MSQDVKAAMLASKDLRPSERLVLVAIAAHSNRDGEAWPAVATVAEYAGVSPRTVHRVIAKLVQLGRLVVRKVAGIASNVYRLVTGTVTHTGPGSANPGPDTANQADGSANHNGNVADEVKSKNPNPQRQPYGYPERRGAALPPDNRAEQCPRHRGSLAANCGPCRSEALGGAA